MQLHKLLKSPKETGYPVLTFAVIDGDYLIATNGFALARLRLKDNFKLQDERTSKDKVLFLSPDNVKTLDKNSMNAMFITDDAINIVNKKGEEITLSFEKNTEELAKQHERTQQLVNKMLVEVDKIRVNEGINYIEAHINFDYLPTMKNAFNEEEFTQFTLTSIQGNDKFPIAILMLPLKDEGQEYIYSTHNFAIVKPMYNRPNLGYRKCED